MECPGFVKPTSTTHPLEKSWVHKMRIAYSASNIRFPRIECVIFVRMVIIIILVVTHLPTRQHVTCTPSHASLSVGRRRSACTSSSTHLLLVHFEAVAVCHLEGIRGVGRLDTLALEQETHGLNAFSLAFTECRHEFL